MREVYIGNGKTIEVDTGNGRKEYDWERLQELLDSGVEVVAGMSEDWFFTAQTLTQGDIDEKKIAGIGGSDWATPSIEVDGGERIDCYKGVE